jgi:hypothetical protein
MNIICFDTEWLYNDHKKDEKFNLNCEYILKTLRDLYGIDYIYRRVLTRDNLKLYMEQFKGKRFKNKYQLIYISSHGWNHSISMEGESKKESTIDLEELAKISPNFFEDRIVHFSSCRTMKNTAAVCKFKEETKALLISGYKNSVDAMDSLVFDMAYFNALQNYTLQTVAKETSKFQQRYASLIDHLQFCIV